MQFILLVFTIFGTILSLVCLLTGHWIVAILMILTAIVSAGFTEDTTL